MKKVNNLQLVGIGYHSDSRVDFLRFIFKDVVFTESNFLYCCSSDQCAVRYRDIAIAESDDGFEYLDAACGA